MLDLLKLYIEVVDQGGISAASRRLKLTPSTASRQLSALEEKLGVRLLHRSTRALRPTEAGRLYYERARRIVLDLEEANQQVMALDHAPRGTLRINGPAVFGRRRLAPALAGFLERYPEIEIDLTLTDRFVDLIEEGADIAIRVGNLPDSSLIARRLAPNYRVICASPAYLEEVGPIERPERLTELKALVYKMSTPWHLQCNGARHEIPVHPTVSANDADALRVLTLAGTGVALLPTWLVGEDLVSGRLIRLLPDYHADISPVESAIHAVYPHNRHLSAKVRALVDYLAEEWRDTDWSRLDGQALSPDVAGERDHG